MYSSSLLLSAATALTLLTSSAAAVPKLEKVNDASVELDLTAQHVVPVPGGTQLGIPVTSIKATSDDYPEWDGAKCSGYSWTTTYDADTDAEYANVVVRLDCVLSDGTPLTALEQGNGKTSRTALRRIEYEVGAPHEHLRREFFLVEVNTPVPDMTVTVYKIVQ